MIEKIDTSQIQEPLEKSSPRRPNAAADPPNNDADVSLQLNYASFIDEAVQTPQTNTEAVQQAQELLMAGQLESPQNIRAAAENILKFGI